MVSLAGWTFHTASPNIGIQNDDEYVGTFVAPANAGVYDYAYRVSTDGGASFTYCDYGDNGNLDGYAPSNAGHLGVDGAAGGPAFVPALGAAPQIALGVGLLSLGLFAGAKRRRRPRS